MQAQLLLFWLAVLLFRMVLGAPCAATKVVNSPLLEGMAQAPASQPQYSP